MNEKEKATDISKDPTPQRKKPSTEGLRFRQFLWVSAIVLVFVGFLCHMGFQVQIFLSYEVIRVNQQEREESTLPEIIICMPSYFGVLRTKLYKFNGTLEYKDDIFSKNLWKLWNFILTSNKTNDFKNNLEALNSAKLTFLPKIARLMVGSTIADAITFCRYDGKYCDHRNFTSFFDKQYGLCIMFLPIQKQLQKYQQDAERGLNLNLIMEKEKLQLDSSRILSSLVLGYTIFIRPQGAWPVLGTPDAIGQGSRQILIGFQQSRLQYLDRPGFRCVQPIEKKLCRLNYKTGLICRNYIISETIDKQIRYQEYLINQCSCVSYEWPIPEKDKHFPSCHHLPDEVYLSKAINIAAESVTTVSGQNISLNSIMNMEAMTKRVQCFLSVKENIIRNPNWSANVSVMATKTKWIKSCTEIKYSLTVSDYQNPFAAGGFSVMTDMGSRLFMDDIRRILKVVNESNGTMTSVLQQRIDEKVAMSRDPILIKQEGVHLNLYAQTSKLDAKLEELRYDPGQFFADIGGLSGVWIGLSALSLLTLLDKLLRTILKCTRKRKSWECSEVPS